MSDQAKAEHNHSVWRTTNTVHHPEHNIHYKEGSWLKLKVDLPKWRAILEENQLKDAGSEVQLPQEQRP